MCNCLTVRTKKFDFFHMGSNIFNCAEILDGFVKTIRLGFLEKLIGKCRGHVQRVVTLLGNVKNIMKFLYYRNCKRCKNNNTVNKRLDNIFSATISDLMREP